MFSAPRDDLPRALALLAIAIDVTIAMAGAGIALLVFGNVLSRFVFNWDVAWSGELVTFLLVWGSFLGGTAALVRGAHMRIGDLIEMLSAAPRRALEAVCLIAVLALLLMVLWQGIAISARTWGQETTVLYWPQGLLYAGMPLAALLSLPFVLNDLWLLARGRLPSWQET
jgi:TRAP-type C4-dicarboxylate transport system permease small subunit